MVLTFASKEVLVLILENTIVVQTFMDTLVDRVDRFLYLVHQTVDMLVLNVVVVEVDIQYSQVVVDKVMRLRQVLLVGVDSVQVD
jgi:hypothetical protein